MINEVEPEQMLVDLLNRGIVFVNNHWWRDDWSDERKNTFGIFLNINDVFAPASDAEEIFFDDLETIYALSKHEDNYHGLIIWAAKRRKRLPWSKVLKDFSEEEKQDMIDSGCKENTI